MAQLPWAMSPAALMQGVLLAVVVVVALLEHRALWVQLDQCWLHLHHRW